MTVGAGSLRVVGTGIHGPAHVTAETAAIVARAERVYALVDPLTLYWLRTCNAAVVPLDAAYAPGKDRARTYREIVDRVLDDVRAGHDVCFAVYGHPGVFALAPHDAVRQARAEGFAATMSPAVSAEDCLFADLGVDPGAAGLQSYEATDFLVYHRAIDVRSALVLWQIGVIGERSIKREGGAWNRAGLGVLAEVLAAQYGGAHEAVVYEAASNALCDPAIERVPLASLASARVSAIATLYVPPREPPVADETMLRRLGMAPPG